MKDKLNWKQRQLGENNLYINNEMTVIIIQLLVKRAFKKNSKV